MRLVNLTLNDDAQDLTDSFFDDIALRMLRYGIAGLRLPSPQARLGFLHPDGFVIEEIEVLLMHPNARAQLELARQTKSFNA